MSQTRGQYWDIQAGEYDGDVGEYLGLDGDAGDVGEYFGLVGEYLGLVGLICAGLVGESTITISMLYLHPRASTTYISATQG